MKYLNAIFDFLLSLRTTIWLIVAVLIFLLFGAFIMPVREEFQSISSMPMFMWLWNTPLIANWWLWGAIAGLSLLTANTIVCSIESIIRKRENPSWLLIIAPQIIHIGVLFILLAHLVSGSGAFKGQIPVAEGKAVRLANGLIIGVKSVDAYLDSKGFTIDWKVVIDFYEHDKKVLEDVLGPNKPAFYKGIGVYLKDIDMSGEKTALLEISREPGSVYALIGGILFTLGTILLVAMKIRRES